MIAAHPMFGHLAKSGPKMNTPQEGDTRLTIPGLLQPTIEIPLPFFSFYSTVQSQLAPINSWMYSQNQLFNLTSLVDIMALGPGLWDLRLFMDLEEQGAVSDATSTCDVLFFALDGTGATVSLARVTNKQGLNQSQDIIWRQLVTADQTYVFRLSRVIGAGTGLNLARIRIIAVRLF